MADIKEVIDMMISDGKSDADIKAVINHYNKQKKLKRKNSSVNNVEVKEDLVQEDIAVEQESLASEPGDTPSESRETETGPITIEPVSTDITKGEEEEAEGLLADKYGRYGFSFTGSGATDNIIITGPPTEEFPEGEQSPAFSIDNWNILKDSDQEAADGMTKWMQARVKTDQGSNLLANMSDVEVTEEQTAQNAIDDENILENYHYDVSANKAEEEDNERRNNGK